MTIQEQQQRYDNENSDRRQRKGRTVYNDWYTPFVRYMTEHVEGLEHLERKRRQWKPPKGLRHVKYSTVKPEHKRYRNEGRSQTWDYSVKERTKAGSQ
ncbi:hypothetical protein [Lentibacillus daqui]|uniref:hypothetical protein n=1 Tax=Lentibacillus daqui TaxID=2911514 RepID=UPI0022B10DAF|nr:hypothetical protein [Lentibacillus daqui]